MFRSQSLCTDHRANKHNIYEKILNQNTHYIKFKYILTAITWNSISLKWIWSTKCLWCLELLLLPLLEDHSVESSGVCSHHILPLSLSQQAPCISLHPNQVFCLKSTIHNSPTLCHKNQILLNWYKFMLRSKTETT